MKKTISILFILIIVLIPSACSMVPADIKASQPAAEEPQISSEASPSAENDRKENISIDGQTDKKADGNSDKNTSDSTEDVNSPPLSKAKPENPKQTKTAPETKDSEPAKKNEGVTISIYIKDEKRYILSPVDIAFIDGDSVFDVLKNVTRQNGIHMESSGRSESVYIEGIDNIYEFDKGPKSGWLFYINGKRAEKGAGAVKVKSGDIIEWIYTTDFKDSA